MTSTTASTQTEWSWIQDLSAVNRSAATTAPVKDKVSKGLDSHEATREGETIKKSNQGRKENAKVPNGNIDIGNYAKEGRQVGGISVDGREIDPLSEGAISKVEDKKANDLNPSFPDKKECTAKHQAALQGTAAELDISSPSDSGSEGSIAEELLYRESPFPSVGLPQMLNFLRETAACTTPEDLKEKYKSHFGSEKVFYESFFSGPCQFCSEEVLPLPTVHEIKTLKSSELFCCEQYEEFVKLYITYQSKNYPGQEIIDINPHAPYGSKAARKAAKERAAERMREKELEKQKAATAQANFFSFTRQVKTIQFSLSSQKCIQDGWTVVPKVSQFEPVIKESEEFSADVNTSLLQKKYQFYERFYENGNRFLVIFADGTGCCYYPSGNAAVIITSYEEGKYHYILQTDSDEYDTDDPGILGIFEPRGKASCYFQDGSLRLVLTPHYGVQIDKNGNYKKKWRWHFIKGHVHTPPFQPICFALNKEMSCRIMEQDHIVITFTSGQRTVRFNVGAKLKAIKQSFPAISLDEHEQLMESVRKRVQIIQDKIQLMMKFSKSPKLNVLISQKEQGKTNASKGATKVQLPKLKGKEPSVTVN